MSYSTRRIITDKGTFYACYQSVIDMFITPALSLVEYGQLMRGTYNDEDHPEYWMREGRETQHEYDMRRWSIHTCLRLMAELKAGRSITDEEACQLYKFREFLRGTVAPQQFEYSLINEEGMDKWIDELGLRKLYDEDYDWQDILDNCESRAYFNAWARTHYSWYEDDDETIPTTPEQLKLAGRYLSAMCNIAQIGGPGKVSPKDIVRRFIGKYRFRHSPEQAAIVVAHAKQQRRRKRNPSMSFQGENNPRKALALAELELRYAE